ncbi:hypothetical protein [Romboutsia sp.]|uniref:hypothetical protein n=1 Tax=Romboutsia sp. TaxID=1965302 RepID=UPI002D050A3A|nr:hypothetical protein [Romboutsia sp.]HSQ88710.1 hypothetical protein [Romboutsia sp.]
MSKSEKILNLIPILAELEDKQLSTVTKAIDACLIVQSINSGDINKILSTK